MSMKFETVKFSKNHYYKGEPAYPHQDQGIRLVHKKILQVLCILFLYIKFYSNYFVSKVSIFRAYSTRLTFILRNESDSSKKSSLNPNTKAKAEKKIPKKIFSIPTHIRGPMVQWSIEWFEFIYYIVINSYSIIIRQI